MAEDSDSTTQLSGSFDPAFQSEKLGFEPEQMVVCEKCDRENPPNRISCLYCGGALGIDPAFVGIATPALNKPEIWQHGFNLIARPASKGHEVDTARASAVLSLGPSVLESILNSPIPLPVARLETEHDALSIRHVLESLGLATVIVSDEALSGQKPPSRIRSVNFVDDSISLILFNSSDHISFTPSDLLLIVEGVISESRVEQLEKKRLRGKSRVIDGSSLTSVEPILDIYTGGNPAGYRIKPTGFDFSCLGKEKSILAADNLKRLILELKHSAPDARYVDNYSSVRQQLGEVWEIEIRQESTGFRHANLGQKGFGTIASTSNLIQFTKFSRLQRLLL